MQRQQYILHLISYSISTTFFLIPVFKNFLKTLPFFTNPFLPNNRLRSKLVEKIKKQT